MARFLAGTCGMFAELATWDSTATTHGLTLLGMSAGLMVAVVLLWHDARRLADRVIGADL